MGENSLMLCGNEQLVKWLIPYLFSCLGLNAEPSNPLSVCLYSFSLLVFVAHIIAPIEKSISFLIGFYQSIQLSNPSEMGF